MGCTLIHEQHLDAEQFGVAAAEEKKRRHDVMAHVHTFGTVAPSAAGIIQYVLLISLCPPLSNQRSMMIASARRPAMLQSMYDRCNLSYFLFSNPLSQQRGPHLHPHRSYTHLQETCSRDQPLRRFRKSISRFAHVGLYTLSTCAADHSRQARNSLVASPSVLCKYPTDYCLIITPKEFLWDLRNIKRARDDLGFRGVKGTTGTQASFLALFDGDHDKVRLIRA